MFINTKRPILPNKRDDFNQKHKCHKCWNYKLYTTVMLVIALILLALSIIGLEVQNKAIQKQITEKEELSLIINQMSKANNEKQTVETIKEKVECVETKTEDKTEVAQSSDTLIRSGAVIN